MAMSCALIQAGMSCEAARLLKGTQPGEEHVDDHECGVVGRVDEDVVRGVVRAVVGEFEALAADLQYVVVVEGHRGRRTVGVGVDAQQAVGLGVADAHHVLAKYAGGSDVVSVGVGVHQVRDLGRPAVGTGHFLDGPQQVVPEGRRGVDEYDAVRLVWNMAW